MVEYTGNEDDDITVAGRREEDEAGTSESR